MKKIKTLSLFTLLFLSLLWNNSLQAQGCFPDVVSPTLVCDGDVVVEVLPGEQLTITSADVLETAFDDCTAFADLEFFIGTDPSTGSPPTTTSITFPMDTSGIFPVAIWVLDESGNLTVCWTNIYLNLLSVNCATDNEPPTFSCQSLVNVSSPVGLDFAIEEQMILSGFGFDNCTSTGDIEYFLTADPNLTTPPNTDTIYFPAGVNDTVSVFIWGVDEAGNFAVCETQLHLEVLTSPCFNDITPPIAVCDQLVTSTSFAGNDFTITASFLDDGSTDNCTAPSSLEFFITLDPNLTSPPTTDTLIIPGGVNDTVIAFLWVVDLAGNFNYCAVEVILNSLHTVEGKVFVDANQDCLFDESIEDGVDGFTIRYTFDQGATYEETNNFSDGSYQIHFPNNIAATEMTVEVLLPNGISTSCLTTQTLTLPLTSGVAEVNFALQLADDCDNMVVDVSNFTLRSCVPNYYAVSYCNLSAYDIDDVEIILTLPADMTLEVALAPYTDLGNNTFLFEIGTVPAGTCEQISMSIFLDCNTPLGATRCVEAAITPNNCNDNINWTGSNLRVEGECDETNNEVRFTITNQSASPMVGEQTASVVEDVIMYMTSPVQLGAGETEVFQLPANGSTWRLDIPQENGHPSLSISSASIEGCGGYGSMGIIYQFSTPDVDPFIAIECSEVTGSYDPNDKQAFPIGIGSEHFIEPNTSLEYKIRFQNTGTDTAFLVRLEDKLSADLDWTSIQAGASSHPYRVELGDEGLLVFHFENILLPDSTTNLEASQGFVQFRINQKRDNAIGTVIENTAGIYFDFNEAVITNTVFHTIGTNFISTNTIKTFAPELDLTIAPNPFSDYTIFTLGGVDVEDGQFELYDLMGRLVRQDNFSNNQFRLQRNGLPSGAYLFSFKNEKGMLANGKLIVN